MSFVGLLCAVFIVAWIYIPGFPIPPQERREIGRLVGQRQFNFVAWEAAALRTKIGASLSRADVRLDEAAQKELVLEYLTIVGEVRRLDRELESIYAMSDDPEQAAKPIVEALAARRAESAEIQPIAEKILQNQVSFALKSEDMQWLRGVWPPVMAHMTPLPLMLIVSPRDRIEQQTSFALAHGLSIPERDQLESEIFEQLGLSALVVPIGGLGIYPAMVVETGNLNFLVDTIAHEWAHHWLTLHPLGLNYAQTPALRTINETTASLVGRQIGAQVIEQYYPERVSSPTGTTVISESPAFDFRAEMRETRVRVDELLAAGDVESAEMYMESRRLLFVENGYLIRKLNQAYFAFYGAYADRGGATGSDPVGPTVVALREQSASLRDFLKTIAPVTSFEALQALVE